MTLEELIVGNSYICMIDADIRDYSNGKALLIDKYHIGVMAVEDKMPKYGERRWHTISKPINYKDIGRDYWGVFLKNIPQHLLKMEVQWWDLRHGWSTNNGLNEHKRLVCNLKGKDDCVAVIEPDKQKMIENNNAIEGQMTIDEMLGLAESEVMI